jgi:hypothetical protein
MMFIYLKKILKRSCLVFICLGILLSGNFLYSEEVVDNYTEQSIDEWHVGIGASTFSGTGLVIQYLLTTDYRLKTGLFYYLENTGKYDKRSIFFGGLEIQRNIFTARTSRLFFLFGGSYYYEKEKSHNFSSRDTQKFIGPGFGFEEYIVQKLALQVSFGFQFRMDSSEDGYLIFPGGGVSLTYGF